MAGEFSFKKIAGMGGIEIRYVEKCPKHDHDHDLIVVIHDYEHEEITQQTKDHMLFDAKQSLVKHYE